MTNIIINKLKSRTKTLVIGKDKQTKFMAEKLRLSCNSSYSKEIRQEIDNNVEEKRFWKAI